jgi:uncharacterized protein involved in exopolysaccharide biosynthesis
MIVLAKHRYLILLAFVLTTVVAVASVRMLPPSYQSTAKVLVRVDQEAIPAFFTGISAAREPTTIDNSIRRLENEIQLMEAFPLSMRVVEDLGLTYDQVYHPPLSYLIWRISDALEPYLIEYLDLRPDPKRRGKQETAEAFRKALSVRLAQSRSAEGGADVLEVTLKGIDPALTARMLEHLLTIYTANDRRVNAEIGRKAQDIVGRQLDRAKADLTAAQHRLGEYIAVNGVPRRAGSSEQANAGGRSVADVLSSPRDPSPIGILKARLMEMEIDLVTLQRTYPGRVDQIRSLQDSIAILKGRLDREQKRAAENETVLLALERDLRLAENLAAELERRHTQIGFYLSINESESGNRTVIEPPMVPRESNKRSAVVLAAFASLAGLLFGVGVAGLREMTDHRLENEADVQQHLGVPVLAVVPRASRRQRRRAARFGAVRKSREAYNV